MIGRVSTLLYGLLSYLLFFVAFSWAVAFVGDFGSLKTIDTGAPTAVGPSILIDTLLIALFGLQHSIMARPGFKQRWTMIVPPSCERSTYVLLSSLLLLVVLWQWRPLPMTLWRADGAWAILLRAVSATGWLVAVTSTYLIDHFELFGLRQAFAGLRAQAAKNPTFVTPLLYRLVRHPLMLGFLLAFWATPHMTLGHLLFAVLTTAYILVGVRLEEQDLLSQFGTRYELYRQRVPMLLPTLRRRRASSDG